MNLLGMYMPMWVVVVSCILICISFFLVIGIIIMRVRNMRFEFDKDDKVPEPKLEPQPNIPPAEVTPPIEPEPLPTVEPAPQPIPRKIPRVPTFSQENVDTSVSFGKFCCNLTDETKEYLFKKAVYGSDLERERIKAEIRSFSELVDNV